MNTDTALDLIEAAEYLAHLKASGAPTDAMVKAAGVGHITELYAVLRFLRHVGVNVPKSKSKTGPRIAPLIKKPRWSAESRAAMSVAAKARWARYRAEKQVAAVAAE